MTPALPLGHELKAEWRFRVIYEEYYTLSKEMSFLTPATQGARVCLFLSMPLNTGPHRIPIIGMESNSALSAYA